MTPKVTAIVSAYYGESYVEKRLENLLAQGMNDDLQIVVVCQYDSKEEAIARDILKVWKEVPEGYSVIHDVIPVSGIPTVYKAWNTAIEYAKGELLTFANCDDLLYDGALKRLVRELDGHPGSAVVYADVDRTVEYGGQPQARFEYPEGGLPELYWNGCFLGSMPLWRRSLHDKYGLFDPELRVSGDYDFWMRIAAEGEKFHHVKGFVSGACLERQDALQYREPVRTVWEQSRVKRKVRHIIDTVK